MQLTARSNYAMRLLMYCALRPGAVTPIAEIARACNMSEAHLGKIANDLSHHGYVETVRGRAGGVRLARSAGQVNLGEVVRATELQRCLVECLDRDTNSCPLIEACRLRSILARALDAFLSVLDGYTLADLVVERAALSEALGLETRGMPEAVAG